MFDKKKATETKNRIVAMYSERPVEMLLATAAVIGAAGKVIHSINEAQNAATWRKEVKRRERNSF